ncbi:TIGR03564 family F420-dependent LLM class oxidoreductase [Mycolicibacterium neworleansense]|uniref:Luciferase family protein n=1 Tax=Mycolicibacterium neworleansense TaxID=146018 RepID=A0A0H5RTL5_9MYCO|nr:TIGR03564 family F420-dependent LLM class oxidoreductase [Mycolicibacterium neworleansense]CRZ16842.1 luciferase family protein [Mycolicibacterium neworleansense]
MRIGLTGGGSTVESILRQARIAEEQGFSSLWYASNVASDPLTAMALAGRETSWIELGTAVLQTYPCHPLLQANRVTAAADAMGRPGLTLGLGASHATAVEGLYGLSYAHPGRNTEEYLTIITALLRGEQVDFTGHDWSAHTSAPAAPAAPVQVLLSALSPRMLRVAGAIADGTILWMASAKAIESHIVPRIATAATAAGRPSPRIVAGLPVAVHDDESAARSATAATAGIYGGMPNYQRIIETGGGSAPADLAIVGNEKSVRSQLQSLLDAGATDIWAQPVAVGVDRTQRSASRQRTIDLLRELLDHRS